MKHIYILKTDCITLYFSSHKKALNWAISAINEHGYKYLGCDKGTWETLIHHSEGYYTIEKAGVN